MQEAQNKQSNVLYSNVVPIPTQQLNYMTEFSETALQSKTFWDGSDTTQTKQDKIQTDSYRTTILVDNNNIKANSSEETKTLKGFQNYLKKYISNTKVINMMGILTMQELEVSNIQIDMASEIFLSQKGKQINYNTQTKMIEVERQWTVKPDGEDDQNLCTIIHMFDPVNETIQFKVKNQNGEKYPDEFEKICKSLMSAENSFYFSTKFNHEQFKLIIAINNDKILHYITDNKLKPQDVSKLKPQDVSKQLEEIKDQLSQEAKYKVESQSFVGDLEINLTTAKGINDFLERTSEESIGKIARGIVKHHKTNDVILDKMWNAEIVNAIDDKDKFARIQAEVKRLTGDDRNTLSKIIDWFKSLFSAINVEKVNILTAKPDLKLITKQPSMVNKQNQL
jgi:hypothetical protein